jgi:hypothetical protein
LQALLATADGWRVVDETIARCLGQGVGIVLALRLTRPREHAVVFASPGAWRVLAEGWKQLVARYRDAGATHIKLLDEKSLGHEYPGAATLNDALEFLEDGT